MSIDARITSVERNADGTATINLAPRDDRVAPAGQSSMTVLNPPPCFEACVGTEIWGNAQTVMVRDSEWADRIGYTQLRLVDRWRVFGRSTSGKTVFRCSVCGRHSQTPDQWCPAGCGKGVEP